MKKVTVILCALIVISSTYAYRQRAWALKLKSQLELTNQDDVKLMHTLNERELQVLADRLRSHGESRMANWIAKQYLGANDNVMLTTQ